MNILEKDLEEIIEKTYFTNNDKLIESGLYISGVLKRQLRIGNYGIADLVSFDKGYVDFFGSFYHSSELKGEDLSQFNRAILIKVYELKKEKIGISAFLQAIGYAKGIKNYFNKRNCRIRIIIEIVLIGKKVDTSGSFCFIPDLFENVSFYTYKYEIDGLKFNRQYNYKLTKENF